MSDSAPPDLDLSAEQPRRTGYLHPLPHYVPIYGTKVRGIQVWMAKGRAAQPPELPPLDDPEAMLGWWTRHAGQAVPAKLTLAAQRARAAKSPAPASAPPGPTSPSSSATSPPPPSPGTPPASNTHNPRAHDGSFDDIEGMTLADAMPRLGKVLALAMRDYEQRSTASEKDETAITLAANRLDKVIERHRKLEVTLLESAQKRGELIPLADLRAELTRLVNTLTSSLVDALMANLGLTRPAAVAFADDWFASVRASRFYLAADQPPAAPPIPTAA